MWLAAELGSLYLPECTLLGELSREPFPLSTPRTVYLNRAASEAEESPRYFQRGGNNYLFTPSVLAKVSGAAYTIVFAAAVTL